MYDPFPFINAWADAEDVLFHYFSDKLRGVIDRDAYLGEPQRTMEGESLFKKGRLWWFSITGEDGLLSHISKQSRQYDCAMMSCNITGMFRERREAQTFGMEVIACLPVNETDMLDGISHCRITEVPTLTHTTVHTRLEGADEFELDGVVKAGEERVNLITIPMSVDIKPRAYL